MTKNAAVEAMYCSLVLMLIYMLWPVAGGGFYDFFNSPSHQGQCPSQALN